MAGMILGFQTILRAFRVRAAPDGGVHYTDGQNGDAACDRAGNLWVRDALPPTTGSFNTFTVPGVDNQVIRAVPNVMTEVGGFNDSAAALYVQLFNRTTAPPAATAPNFIFYVPAGQSFSWTPTGGGFRWSLGLVFAVSSTRDTYTTLATSIFFFARGYNT